MHRRRVAIAIAPLLLIGVAAAILWPPGAAPAAAQSAEPTPACFEITPGWRICASSPKPPPAIVSAAVTVTGPAVRLAGPLVVLSEVVGARTDAEGKAIETRRVFLVDRATQRYWPALDYHNGILVKGDEHRSLPLAVQPAGRHLIVWGTGQVARVSLTGQIETILFEDSALRAVQVSPDGSHVAVLYGRPGTLLVIESATGVERLRVAHDDLALTSLRTGRPPDQLEIGNWRPDGTALSITETFAWFREYIATAIVGLDGSVSVLPEDWWWLSPDLRYALRFGAPIGAAGYLPVWQHWEVIEVATGVVRWVIAADEGGVQLPSWDSPWMRQSRYLAFSWPAVDGLSNRVLDTATGEIAPHTPAFRRTLFGPDRGVCANPAHPPDFPETSVPDSLSCDWYDDGQGVWEGDRQTVYHGRLAPVGGVQLAGIALQEIPQDPVPPPPPAREAMVGPLLLYSVKGDYAPAAPAGADARETATRRVIAYDQGTGQSWLVLTYRVPGFVQAAQGGIVAAVDQGLLYVTPDGQARTLADQKLAGTEFRVAPDGRRVVARLTSPDRFVVFALPTGDPILEVAADDLIVAAGRDPALTVLHPAAYGRVEATLGNDGSHGSYWEAGRNAWTADATAILIFVVAHGHDDYSAAFDVTVTLDGAIAVMEHPGHPVLTPPPAAAVASCPEEPGPQRCRVLLDGVVVGEGRRPYVIGEVALD